MESLRNSIMGWGTIEYQAPQKPAAKKETISQGNIAQRHLNPGNLIFMEQEGAERGELKEGEKDIYWARFKDEGAGFKAMQKDIEIKLKRTPDMTVRDLILERSPENENSYKTLAYNVADDLKDLKDKGDIPVLLMNQLAASQVPIDRLAQALVKAEGYYAKIKK